MYISKTLYVYRHEIEIYIYIYRIERDLLPAQVSNDMCLYDILQLLAASELAAPINAITGGSHCRLSRPTAAQQIVLYISPHYVYSTIAKLSYVVRYSSACCWVRASITLLDRMADDNVCFSRLYSVFFLFTPCVLYFAPLGSTVALTAAGCIPVLP